MTDHEKRRILIMTADAGFGHRRAAAAIASALREMYGDACAVDLINPLDDRRVLPALRHTQAGHDRVAREMREFYDFWWHASRSAVPNAGVSGALAVALFHVIRDILRRHRPHAIINTYPLYHPPLSAVFALTRRRTPLFTVVTDFGIVHPSWFSEATLMCLVATENVREQALAHGLAPEQVHITGIPVDPGFVRESRDRQALCAELGWRCDLAGDGRPVLTTVLAVGSKRVAHLSGVLRLLNHSGLPLQLAVVAGGDDALYDELARSEWHVPTHLYRWVENMPSLLQAADCVMSKAGGLIVAESLACGRPVLLVDALPDQERGNVELVLESGAGDLAESPGAALEILYHWLARDRALLAERAHNARAAGRPRAAYEVAERVWRTVAAADAM